MTYDANTATWTRACFITVSAPDAENSPRQVALIQEGAAATTDPEDIDGDNAVDVQLVINAVLGIIILFDADVDGKGVVDAVDIQLLINAVLGV